MVAEANRFGQKQSEQLKKQLASRDAAMKRGADRMGRVTGDLNRRFGSEVTSPGIAPQAATFSVAAPVPVAAAAELFLMMNGKKYPVLVKN